MIDGVPLGEGNSRKITCNDSNIPLSWDDFRNMLTTNGILMDLSINEPGWFTLGTKLNKDNLLTDEAAARFGTFDSSVTLDDIFKAIPTGIGTMSWGSIQGDITTQLDLIALLNGKLDKTSIVFSTGNSDTVVMSQNAVTNALSNKVDSIPGKSLSTNDYTNDDKSKVNLINTSGTGDLFLSDDGTYKTVTAQAEWGQITGDITTQMDLINEFNTKINLTSLVQNTGESTSNIMSQKAVTDALGQIATNTGGYRGVVLHAFSTQSIYLLSTVTINNAGSGYVVGELAILNLLTDRLINGFVVITSVDSNGAVTGVSIKQFGAWSTDQSATNVSINSSSTGTGLTFNVSMASGNSTNLNDISSPMQGDSALVLQDETNGNLRWNWLYADLNGDGIKNWMPAGSNDSSNVIDDEIYITSASGVRTLTSAKQDLVDGSEQTSNKLSNGYLSNNTTMYPSLATAYRSSVYSLSTPSITNDSLGLYTIGYVRGGTSNLTNIQGIIPTTRQNYVLATNLTSTSTPTYPTFRPLDISDLPPGLLSGFNGIFTVSSWPTAPNTVEVTIANMTANHDIDVDIVCSTDLATRQSQLTEFSKLDMIESFDGGIRIYYDTNTPAISLDFKFRAFLFS